MIKANFHTHSTFSDGANTPEEMVQTAISLGMTALGFSDHSPIGKECVGTTGMAFEKEAAYRQEILRLKEVYADRLPIYLGIEQDSNSPRTSYLYDYTIGSIHGIWAEGQYRAVDCNEQTMLETVMADYREPYPGAKHRVETVLRIMLTAWAAGRMRQQAEKMLDHLKEEMQYE